MSVAEQRYLAVLAVISEGRSVSEVAAAWRVSRQTMHAWLARYEAEGLEGLADRSHRPVSRPHQHRRHPQETRPTQRPRKDLASIRSDKDQPK
jgi:transposase